MTLRGRLTTAFLVVVLGPVLLGSIFVAVTVATVSRDRTDERLDRAGTGIRTAIGAVCRQLQAVADTVAVVPPGDRPAVAAQLIARGLAGHIQVVDKPPAALRSDKGGNSDGVTGGELGGSGTGGRGGGADAGGGNAGGLDGSSDTSDWQDCAAPVDGPIRAIAATATGPDLVVTAAQPVDADFLERLAASGGARVTLTLGPTPKPEQAVTPGNHDEAGTQASAEPHPGPPASAASPPSSTGTGINTGTGGGMSTGTGHSAAQNSPAGKGDPHTRRLSAGPGQPLPLTVTVRTSRPTFLYAVLTGLVLAAAVAAVLVARWLAHSTTRPLGDLAWAADRVANGDLETRVPVLRPDELGRLAGTFNRMTRELQAYVQALTASRDQLRGHLAILGETLSSTHDLHRILQVILRTALAATGARAGLVLLIDPAGTQLVAQCGVGLTGSWDVPDDQLRERRLPVGPGLLGGVAATGEARRGQAEVGTVEPPCRTYVAVPICAPATVGDALVPGDPVPSGMPATLGVLALYDRVGGDPFDEADLHRLRTFAGQAGVAVHNVRVHEEAQRLSLTDPLTGLWNYRYLRASLRREVERASRFGRMLTVLVLDLDHFKEVNDTYGHAAGDTVLGEFARRIRLGLREVDVAFRQGGEEFVVLLPETDAYGGAIVAERLGAAVRDRPVAVEGRRPGVPEEVAISVSIGVAVFPEHGGTAQQVLDAADDALYAAKKAGRDTYRLAEPIEVGTSPAAPGVPDVAATMTAGPHPPWPARGR